LVLFYRCHSRIVRHCEPAGEAISPPRVLASQPVFRHCEPAGFPSLRASRRGNLSPPPLNDLARLPRRLAIAALLATTTIFPSLRASRLFVIASQQAKQSRKLSFPN